jgi:hypothetical protein
VRAGPLTRVVLAVGIAAMLGMGIFQAPFYGWARDAAASLRNLAVAP